MTIALAACATLAASAAAAPERAAGTLQVRATVSAGWQFRNCSATVRCIDFRARAVVPGLGIVTALYTKTEQTEGCPEITQFRAAVLSVEGKGELHVSALGPVCGNYAPADAGPLELTVTGGSGRFAEASGTGEFRSSVSAGHPSCACGGSRDTWTLSLSVPGLEFDTTPPVLSGPAAKTVRAPRGSRAARVRYAVTALDTTDGTLPVTCRPRSGSLFKLGRTSVTCSATDSSGNTGRTRFVVTVR